MCVLNCGPTLLCDELCVSLKEYADPEECGILKTIHDANIFYSSLAITGTSSRMALEAHPGPSAP